MRRRLVGAIMAAAVALAIVPLLTGSASAQAPGPAAHAAAIPRTADGKPDFSGIWQRAAPGQAANPTLPWPQFDVSSYRAAFDYDTPSARVEMVRRQTIRARTNMD